MTFFPDFKTVVSFGGLHITWYAVFVLSAAFVCYYLSLRTLKKQGYKTQMFEDFFIYMLPIAIIGARLWFVIFDWQRYSNDLIRIFYIWEGGLAIHGGIIAATLFGLWYFRKRGVDVLRVADAIFPNLLVAQAIGRWGNFINQEAFGEVVKESFYNGWPAFIKDQMLINGQYRQPTFLFEGVGNLIGFILITFVYKKYGRQKRGDLAFAYITWYGLVRVVVEGMRTDSLMLGNIRIAQLISILGMIVGILGILGLWHKLFKNIWPFKKKKPAVIFDLDGTLVDTEELIFASFRHTFKKYKPEYELKDEELKSFLGPTLKQSFLTHFSEDKIDDLIACYRSFNLEHHDDLVKEVPGVKETLSYLKEHDYALAVMSNKVSDIVKMGLKKFDLEEYFEVIIGSEDIAEAKPSPQGLLKACEMLYHGHDDMIYVGDSVSDIQATKNMAGYSVGFTLDSKRESELNKAKPCACINKMTDLITIVKEDHEWSDNTIL